MDRLLICSGRHTAVGLNLARVTCETRLPCILSGIFMYFPQRSPGLPFLIIILAKMSEMTLIGHKTQIKKRNFKMIEIMFSTVCDWGSFGSGCFNHCHCFENASCDNVNGTCSNGACAAGWQGLSCSEGML